MLHIFIPLRPIRRRLPQLAVIAPLLVSLAACGGSDKNDPTGPSGYCGVTPPAGTMTAQVNGVAFSADLNTMATIQNSSAQGSNILQVSGVTCIADTPTGSRQILFTVGRSTPLAPDTYRLEPAAQLQPPGSGTGYSAQAVYSSPPNLWHSNRVTGTDSGSGYITFTSITPTRLQGTFSAVLLPAPGNTAGNTQRITITNGTFDIPRQ